MPNDVLTCQRYQISWSSSQVQWSASLQLCRVLELVNLTWERGDARLYDVEALNKLLRGWHFATGCAPTDHLDLTSDGSEWIAQVMRNDRDKFVTCCDRRLGRGPRGLFGFVQLRTRRLHLLAVRNISAYFERLRLPRITLQHEPATPYAHFLSIAATADQLALPGPVALEDGFVLRKRHRELCPQELVADLA